MAKKNFFKSTGLKTQSEVKRDRTKGAKPREGKFVSELDKLRSGKGVTGSQSHGVTGQEIVPKPKTKKQSQDFNKGFGEAAESPSQEFTGQLAWNTARKGVK